MTAPFICAKISSGGEWATRPRGGQTAPLPRPTKVAPARITALSGQRLHLNDGPIDLIIYAEGPDRDAAYIAAMFAFEGLLGRLAAELPALRDPNSSKLTHPVALAMARAIAPFRPAFITPMAAVAGAVADAILAAMVQAAPLTRAYVNNGGDIAFHLAPGATLTAAIGLSAQRVTLRAEDPARGIATSGWRGRSQSMGIADAVTVTARTAAMADAAATMIANAVNLPGHPSIARVPAHTLKADSDLGCQLVTTGVGALSAEETARALDRGQAFAEICRARGLIEAAALFLQGEARTAAQKEPALG